MQLVWALWLARLPDRDRPGNHPPSARIYRDGLITQLFAFFLILFAFAARAVCQDFASVSGVVTDSLVGEPIGGVVVTVLPDGRSTTTAANGFYFIDRIAPGSVTLRIESAFHAARTIGPLLIREGESRTTDLLLHPLDIVTNASEVTANRETGPGCRSLEIDESHRAISRDVGDFLVRSGLYIESNGQTKFASLRGFSPQSVLVLVDGVPINPDGSSADLAAIPTESVERVDVYTTGAASRFGANALGGAINVISRKVGSHERSASAAAAHGSFALRRGTLSFTQPQVVGFDVASNYDYQEQRNDFAFDHPYEGSLNRVNNSSRIYSGFLSLRPEILRAVSFQARLSNSHNEIPGAVFQETGGGAMAKRDNAHFSLDYSASDIILSASFRELRQRFSDRGGFIAYDKDYLQTARSLHAEYRRALFHHFVVSAGSDLSSESFFNNDLINPQRSMPVVSRKTAAVYLGTVFSHPIGLATFSAESRYRLDHIAGESHGSPFAGLDLKLRLPVAIGGEVSYSESFRLPPIDAMFWRGDVFSEANPDLRAEQAISREAGINLNYERAIIFSARHIWFHSNLENLIIWRRQFDGKYMPVNIDRSRYVGTETTLAIAPRSKRCELTYHRTSLAAVNLSTSGGYYGQTVPFKPDVVERLSFSVDLHLVKMLYSYSFTGERQIREANTKQQPGFALHDLETEVPFSLWSRRHALRAAIYNFTDVRYELLERMPMPPRSASLTIAIQF